MPRPSQFSFPMMTEAALRRERVRSFLISVAIAVVPYIVSVAWVATSASGLSMLYHGVADAALAGVVIAVSGYCNTIFSFVKLEGWQYPSRWTVFHASMVAVLSILSFVQYLKAAYAPSGHNPSLLFQISVIATLGTMLFAWSLQNTFVSDECRYARQVRRQLPPKEKL